MTATASMALRIRSAVTSGGYSGGDDTSAGDVEDVPAGDDTADPRLAGQWQGAHAHGLRARRVVCDREGGTMPRVMREPWSRPDGPAVGRQRKAGSPVSAWPMIKVWTSLVPS